MRRAVDKTGNELISKLFSLSLFRALSHCCRLKATRNSDIALECSVLTFRHRQRQKPHIWTHTENSMTWWNLIFVYRKIPLSLCTALTMRCVKRIISFSWKIENENSKCSAFPPTNSWVYLCDHRNLSETLKNNYERWFSLCRCVCSCSKSRIVSDR